MKKDKNQTFEVEIVNLLKRLTLDVIGEVAFGVDFDSLGHEKTVKSFVCWVESLRIYCEQFGGFKFSDLADKALNGINARFLTPKFIWDLPLPVFNKEKEAVHILKVLLSFLLLTRTRQLILNVVHTQGMFEGILQQTQEKMNNGEETFNLVSILLDAHNTPEGKLVYVLFTPFFYEFLR